MLDERVRHWDKVKRYSAWHGCSKDRLTERNHQTPNAGEWPWKCRRSDGRKVEGWYELLFDYSGVAGGMRNSAHDASTCTILLEPHLHFAYHLFACLGRCVVRACESREGGGVR